MLELDLVCRLAALGLFIYGIGYFNLGLTFLAIMLAGVYTWERNSRQLEIKRVKAAFSYQQHRSQAAPDGSEDHARWLEALFRTSWATHKPNYDRWLMEQLKVWLTWIPPGQVEYIQVVDVQLAQEEPSNLKFSGWKKRDNDDEVQVDLRFDWVSTSKITLKVKLSKHTPSFHLNIKILKLSGDVRLQLKFCERMPYVGILTFFFTKNPDIDYSIKPANAVDITGLPGLSSYLDDLIRNSLLWYLVHPNKIVCPLEAWWYPEDSSLSTPASQTSGIAVAQGLVELCLVEARGLLCAAPGGAKESIPPSCRAFVSRSHEEATVSKLKSVTSLPAEWDGSQNKWSFGSQTLELMVMDYDTDWITLQVLLQKGKKETVIGSCGIATAQLSKEAFAHPQHQELEAPDGSDSECGYLHCIATYRQKEERQFDELHALNETMIPQSPVDGGVGNQGILELQLKEAFLDKEGVDKVTSFTDMSSRMYCMVEVCRAGDSEDVIGRYKTQDLSDPGENPHWNQTYEFPVFGTEEIRILLFKKKKLGKDYKLDEWVLPLEEHMPSLGDQLYHDFSLESDQNFNPTTWNPNKFKFCVKFVSMRKYTMLSPRSAPGSPGIGAPAEELRLPTDRLSESAQF